MKIMMKNIYKNCFFIAKNSKINFIINTGYVKIIQINELGKQ